MPSKSLPPGRIVEIRMSRIAVRMPVSVARGVRGKSLALSRSDAGRLSNRALFQKRGEYPGEGILAVLATKKERKAEDTIMTATLHSCCIQKASQTISTLPPPRSMPAILTIAMMAMTRERQSTRARPSFWRKLIRTFHRRAIGKDTTKMSVTTSITVVMGVSRIVL